ncbi:MAG: hypothetical protein A2341_19150 [Deltaproteobacteria bacterium RIFOXYB12_FULL_58_9]|nr:MAG: hypothetical protein A2341_19150 [Deltaproteobacteria bacterium RIFOXYB12_FULL_58_9]
MKSLAKVAVLGVTLGFLGACGGARDPVKNMGGGDSDPECMTSQDCPDPLTQYCELSVCKDIPASCNTHQDCPFGKYCHIIVGACVDCLQDDHCEEGKRCQSDGTCGTTSGCVDDDDCGGLRCNPVTQECVRCLSVDDCPPDHECRANACVPVGGDPGCETQNDCNPYGLICNTATQVCESCVEDASGASNCPSPLICSGGRCTNGGGDDTCQTIEDCGGLACFLGTCMQCFVDEMCSLGGELKICDWATRYCTDPECQMAEQCPEGEGCYAGHCGECLDKVECRVGEACLTGVCGPCTDTLQCTSGEECRDGVCTPPEPGTVEMGGLCVSQPDCVEGLTCFGDAKKICTTMCIGSGAGGDVDCPGDGWLCMSFYDVPLEGVSLCASRDQFDSSTSEWFTVGPEGDCTSSNQCQTGMCLEEDGCASLCAADRDCSEEEVCRAENEDDAQSGVQICAQSDTTDWLPVGAACGDDGECDTGMCMGVCSGGTKPCDGPLDCPTLSCIRTCAEACRSNVDCDADHRCYSWPSDVGFDLATFSSNPKGYLPACMPRMGVGTAADGTDCVVASECVSDHCIKNICTSPCATHEDCDGALADKKCRLVTLTDAAGQPSNSVGYCL